ncbi:MAG TPA: hypothetical protein PLT76_01450 [Candidatus Omnitrophota bacterium]|nr:hypothetical protein [Candidatus Omnitrophota bacterium]HQO57374.1 hypothetical protein [Candidatus Omnitrophota bacterium]HQP12389.1 hypothetical protein [Candidatus Omnitrophota bacterium]
MVLQSVKVPPPLVPIFEQAEQYVNNFFDSFYCNKLEGTITISGERYILVNAKSLRLEFTKNLGETMGLNEAMAEEAADHFLYILAKSIGRADAKKFAAQQGVTDPLAKLAAGPISFNYSGWAFVDVFPESRLSQDDDFMLIHDHPYSFECHSFLSAKGAHSNKPVCIMNAGYSAGWTSGSFNMDLDTREIMCRARGDKACRFVMGVKNKLDHHEEWVLNNIKR